MMMNKIIKEKYIEDSISEFDIEGMEQILFQMKYCICRIYKDKIKGTGFFCKIPLGNKPNFLPVLITNNHVLNENDIAIGKAIELTINNDKVIRKINIDDSRKKITNINLDFTFIEIKPNIDNIKSFLNIDENVNGEDLFKIKYKNKSVYTLNYPETKKLKVSFGLLDKFIDKYIIHKCTTHKGSSGSPILSLDTFKVIGIHYGSISQGNLALIIKYAIDEFKKGIKNINEIKPELFKEKISIIYEDYNETKNSLKEGLITSYENNEKMEKNNDEKDKIQLFTDDIVEKYKNNIFLIINGKKHKLSKYLYLKEFEGIKNIDKLLYSKRYNNYYINNYFSLLYYPNSFDFTNIDSNNKYNNMFLLEKKIKLENTAYSLCYLKNKKLIALGMEKKIVLYDLLFNFHSSYDSLDYKVSYIYELNDGKILLTDLNPTIKILKILNKDILIDKVIETKEERNFVAIELLNKKLIIGGKNYLSIIENSFMSGYQLINSLYLNTSVSNIVELNSKLFLIGLDKDLRIIVFSSDNLEIISNCNNINLWSNNYSISKISEEYIAIAGQEKAILSGCIYIFSIIQLNIIKKYYINDVIKCRVILKLRENEFITVGERSENFDLISLGIEKYNTVFYDAIHYMELVFIQIFLLSVTSKFLVINNQSIKY